MDILAHALENKMFYLACGLLGIQLIVLSLGTIIRFNKYKSIGLYARKVNWPTSYKVKIGLQIGLLVLIVAQFVLCFFATKKYIFRYL